MKNHLLVLFAFFSITCHAQKIIEFEYDNFEKQFIQYKPKLDDKISSKDFDYGKMIIEETKSSINNNPENFNLADYFNVLSAFLTLNESEKNIKMAYKKFENAKGSCEYVIAFESDINKNKKYDIIRADYLDKLKKCQQNYTFKKSFNIEQYCQSNSLDIALIKKLNQVKSDDEKYRKEFSKELAHKQNELDLKNQKTIDSLYRKYNTYLGKSIVGEEFETVMWAVIQHSNTEMMAKYIPIVQKAVEENELNVTPFKMLIDRYYGLKHGFQIFGSQSGFGFELADDKKRNEIKLKYGIE